MGGVVFISLVIEFIRIIFAKTTGFVAVYNDNLNEMSILCHMKICFPRAGVEPARVQEPPVGEAWTTYPLGTMPKYVSGEIHNKYIFFKRSFHLFSNCLCEDGYKIKRFPSPFWIPSLFFSSFNLFAIFFIMKQLFLPPVLVMEYTS